MKTKYVKLRRIEDFILDNNSIHSLNMLYKPIINTSNLNLYYSLYEASFLYDEISEVILNDVLQEDNVNLNESFEKLISLRLIETNKDEIMLYPPYLPKEFLMLEFASYLKANTSLVIFDKIMEYYGVSRSVEYPSPYDIKTLVNIPYKIKKKFIDFNDKRIIDYIKTHNAYEIISGSNAAISISDRNTIERLKSELNVKQDLLSLLIMYSLATNNNKLHQFRYYQAIILDWNGKNITTIEDAIKVIDSLYSKKKDDTTSEDWFKGYWEKAKKEEKWSN